MKLGLHQSARLEQRLIQSPQMIQAMQILQLSGLDLQDRIEQELNENPLLEKVEEVGLAPEGDGASEADGETRPEFDLAAFEARLNELERYERDINSRRRQSNNDEVDKKLEALQNTPDSPKTLAEAVSEELAFTDLDERTRDVAEYIVLSLDERGYLTAPYEEIARDCEVPNATVEDVQRALFELRHLIHPAIGSRDLRECLLLQLEHHGFDDPLLRAVVDQHLDDVTTNRLPRIAKSTGRSIEDVKQALDVLRSLDPNPGTGYGGEMAAAIIPDVIVEDVDGSYDVRLNKQRVPTLTLSPQYREYLKLARKGEGDKDWVRKRLESARWFIDAIQQRQSTLQKIADRIFAHQRDFLDQGVRGLHPLRMQEVADEVHVHISTVSRAVSGKYAQTPRGTFPLKYFFTGGTANQDGEVESQASIKQRIKELVEKEDRTKPLSDDELASLLAEKDKIQIARRTVTKYRKALSIPSSSQRKLF
ncbi:MAG: RNA polymerase factor sigma-54 [Planctomycetes bacterium]|nr:RNA polymerase factor sigma-54 [Planctomycetota bacterium]